MTLFKAPKLQDFSASFSAVHKDKACFPRMRAQRASHVPSVHYGCGILWGVSRVVLLVLIIVQLGWATFRHFQTLIGPSWLCGFSVLLGVGHPGISPRQGGMGFMMIAVTLPDHDGTTECSALVSREIFSRFLMRNQESEDILLYF
jgi:hypothetical protein